MTPQSDTQFNYFAEGEQEFQERFKGQRDRWFSPIIRFLYKREVTPDFISLWGMLFLVPFAYLLLCFPDPTMLALCFTFLSLHVLMDGLDGPLARQYGTSGPSGTFVDMCCDHGGMAVVIVALSAAGFVNGALACAYVFLYTVAVVFIIWLNTLGRPFKRVFRSKHLLYLFILIQGITGWDLIHPLIGFFTVYNIGLCAVAFARIKRILAEPNNSNQALSD